MSATTVRYAAHKAMERLEWLDCHVQARPNDVATQKRLAEDIDEIRSFLNRVIGASEQ